MTKRIFEKAELVPGFMPGSRNMATRGERDAKSKTAPGTMMGFLAAQSTAAKDVEKLRAEVHVLRESAPFQRLDPSQVRPSKWANRHPTAFATSDFERLKAEISAAGENVQPIKVRPLFAEPEANDVDVAQVYEVIFGHRRHRACLELGIPVSAVVEQADDLSLFQQMERENRGRKNLSAWEQGKMYGRALDEGLFPSQRKLSEGLGVDLALVSKSLALARLPDEVIQAFVTPLDIQFRWAAGLSDVVQKDPEGVLARARHLKAEAARLKPIEIFDRLTCVSEVAYDVRTPLALTIKRHGKTVGSMRRDASGRVELTLKAGASDVEQFTALAKLVEGLLAG